MGRKTILNPQLQSRIVEGLRLGNYVEDVCKAVGISKQTYYDWRKKGENGESPYVEFLDAVEEAEADAITDALETVKFAAKVNKDWRAAAWFLERRHAKWAKQEKVEVAGNVPIEIEIKWPDEIRAKPKAEKIDEEDREA